MKTQSPDTSPEAERVLIELARKMPAERKLQLAGQFSASMRNLMRAGIPVPARRSWSGGLSNFGLA